MSHRRSGDPQVRARPLPFQAVRGDAPTMPFMGHQMGQFMQEGKPDLLLAMLDQQRVQLDPGILQPGTPGRRPQSWIPAHPQSTRQLAQTECQQKLPTLRRQHPPIQGMLRLIVRLTHSVRLPSFHADGNPSTHP